MIRLEGSSVVAAPAVAALRLEETETNSAKSARETRNIRVPLLKNRVLSRGNCSGGRTGTAKTEFRPPGDKGEQGYIKKATLEHEQKRYRQELAMNYRVPDEIAEIDGKRQFGQRERGFQRPIPAGSPGLGFALDAIFGCSSEIGAVVKDCLEHRPRVVQR